MVIVDVQTSEIRQIKQLSWQGLDPVISDIQVIETRIQFLDLWRDLSNTVEG